MLGTVAGKGVWPCSTVRLPPAPHHFFKNAGWLYFCWDLMLLKRFGGAEREVEISRNACKGIPQ